MMLKKFRLWKWYLYVSDVKLRPPKESESIRHRYRKKLRLLREALHKERAGLCEECGRFVGITECDLHHIIPLSENSDLFLSKNNLRLLCRECHKKEHETHPQDTGRDDVMA